VALVKEDGTGVAGANSYADVADCDAYHAARLNSATWTNASAPDKAIALQMATSLIDTLVRFSGQKADLEQPLEWPRFGAENEGADTVPNTPSALMGLAPGPWYPEEYIPPRLVQATCELARELLAKDRVAALEPEEAGIKSVGVGQGAVDVEFEPAATAGRPGILTEVVERLLAPLGSVGGGSLMRRVERVM
jgi:hypothetical protein